MYEKAMLKIGEKKKLTEKEFDPELKKYLEKTKKAAATTLWKNNYENHNDIK